jgi:hypothetical protein
MFLLNWATVPYDLRALGSFFPSRRCDALDPGEKVGSFFGSGNGCAYFDGWPSDDEDWCTPMAYLPGMSPPLFDQADGRGPPRPRCCVSCCFFLVV